VGFRSRYVISKNNCTFGSINQIIKIMQEQKKSALASILGIALAALVTVSPTLGATAQQWVGLVTFSLTFVLTTWFPSGQFIGQSWKAAMYVATIGGFLLQVLALVGDIVVIPSNWVNYIGMAITFAVSQWGKVYPKTGV